MATLRKLSGEACCLLSSAVDILDSCKEKQSILAKRGNIISLPEDDLGQKNDQRDNDFVIAA